MLGYFWVEPNGYATVAQWRFWLDEALAYNPLAKATPPRKAKVPAAAKKAPPPKTTAKAAASKKHSIFEADD